MKYTFLNSASYKNGLIIPVYKVFDEDVVYYEAIVYGTSSRGTVTKSQSFSHKYRSKVLAWRESKGQESKK